MRTTLTFLVACVMFTLQAQTGEVRGTVIDEGFGEPIIGANVVVVELADQSVGASSDLDGKFSITLDPGTYTLSISYIGLSDLTVEGVEIVAGETINLGELFMTEGSLELEEVVVTSTQIRRTESALIAIKRKAPAMLDGISASRMQLTGDATAIEAAKRVTGVSIEGGKYIYVRGLGDRYTKTTLNGIDIPGLDPDRNSLQLDIFPTTLIDNLMVSKNFTADMPADFTGGLVNIEMKDFPEERIMSLSLSTGFTPGMNLNSNFLSYDGGGTDWLGFDDGARELPAQALDPPKPFIDPDQEVFDFVKSFNPEQGAQNRTSMLDFSAGFTYGNQVRVGKGDKDAKLGYIFSVSYRNETNYYDNAIFGEWQRQEDPDEYEMEYATVQTGAIGENSVLLGGLAGVAYKTLRNKIRLSAMHLQNGEKRAGQFEIDDNGEAVGRSGYFALSDNLEYNQRGLTNVLLHGTHLLGSLENGWELDWKVSPTLSKSEDPDIRKTAYSRSNSDWLFVAGAGGNPSRIWRDLNERSLVGRVDVKKSLKLFDNPANVKFGAMHTYKDRDYEILQFDMTFLSSQSWPLDENGLPDPNIVLNDENIFPNKPNSLVYQSGNNDPNPNQYESNSNNTAFYGSIEFSPASWLRATAGLRAENFTLRHTGRDQQWAQGDFENGNNLENEVVLDALDFFPSVGLIFSLAEKMNIRTSYSKTIARPSFKEMSFAQILDPISNRIFNGSLFEYEGSWDGRLVETRIDNVDLRWEMFMERGQLLSASVFYKRFDKPIELVRIPEQQTSTEFQPRNVGDGQVFGIELEARKHLGFISSSLQNLAIVGNVTFVESRIDMTDTEFNARKQFERTGETIENTREMQGQAPYVVNAGVTYTSLESGWEAGLFYNVKGRTLEVVGVGLYSDVFTVPFHSLNFSINKRFGPDNRSQLDFRVNNILNSTLQSVYGSFRAQDQIFTSIDPGIQLSLGYRHKF